MYKASKPNNQAQPAVLTLTKGFDLEFYEKSTEQILAENVPTLAEDLSFIVNPTLYKRAESKEVIREFRKMYPKELLTASAQQLNEKDRTVLSSIVRELNNEESKNR
jgi:hypothetical protein